MSLERGLMQQLEVAPEAEILGVVAAGGVSGVGSGSAGHGVQWAVLITLSGWKPLGGRLRTSELTVRKVVSESAIRTFMASMDAYDVVRIRARLLEGGVAGSPQALLSEFVGRDDSDPELNAYALELQQPVTFTDPQFGVFTLDRPLDWYEASTLWCGVLIRLTLPANDTDEMEKALAVARRLWTEQDDWQRRITACATEELLGLKNATWLGEAETEIGAAEFTRRMALESISVEAEGEFEFWYDDGELFFGHSIVISGNLTDGPTDAGIHG